MIIDRWTAVDLHDLFTEAIQTERMMPAVKQRARVTWWPDVQAEWLAYADPETQVRLTPTAEQIDRYDLAIWFAGLMEDDERRLVWAVILSGARRARGPRWTKLGKLMGIDRRTVERRYVHALVTLSLRIQAETL